VSIEIRYLLAFFSLACLAFCNTAHSQPTLNSDVLELPREVPPLPGPGESEVKLLVSRANVGPFHELLLAPVASWLKEGKLVVRVVRELSYDWTVNKSWQDATREEYGNFELDQNFRLIQKAPPKSYAALPFGFAADVNQDPDPVRQAYKILWNSVYAQSISQAVNYDMRVNWYGASSMLREAAGKLTRRTFLSPYEEPVAVTAAKETSPEATTEPPTELPAADTSPLSFGGEGDILTQEVLRFLYPSAVAGFSLVDWRYRGMNEDRSWIYSPVIERSRLVFEANRSDAILEGALTLDDIFVWSGRIEMTKAKVVGQKVLLLPFASLFEIPTKLENYPEQSFTRVTPGQIAASVQETKADGSTYVARGSQRTSDGSPVSMSWNYQTRQYVDAAPWMPSGAVFVPRKVWILEISSLNPYYQYGRQILVVDQESMLPFYKIVYTQQGKFHKTVVGSWSLAMTEDRSLIAPINTFTFAVDADFKKASSIHSTATWMFADPLKIPESLSKWFYIRNHEQKNKEPTNTESVEAMDVTVAETPVVNPNVAAPAVPASSGLPPANQAPTAPPVPVAEEFPND